RPWRLTSVEAFAAALFILGEVSQAKIVLESSPWGIRFLELNEEPLELYRNATDSSEIIEIQKTYL
ncbi:MAG: DUF367 domain-containing protein, partial [Methanoregulaceae archaeon]|nr:DUF367 domain-containing protein [Methanoregulaceae archaeon]